MNKRSDVLSTLDTLPFNQINVTIETLETLTDLSRSSLGKLFGGEDKLWLRIMVYTMRDLGRKAFEVFASIAFKYEGAPDGVIKTQEEIMLNSQRVFMNIVRHFEENDYYTTERVLKVCAESEDVNSENAADCFRDLLEQIDLLIIEDHPHVQEHAPSVNQLQIDKNYFENEVRKMLVTGFLSRPMVSVLMKECFRSTINDTEELDALFNRLRGVRSSGAVSEK